MGEGPWLSLTFDTAGKVFTRRQFADGHVSYRSMPPDWVGAATPSSIVIEVAEYRLERPAHLPAVSQVMESPEALAEFVLRCCQRRSEGHCRTASHFFNTLAC